MKYVVTKMKTMSGRKERHKQRLHESERGTRLCDCESGGVAGALSVGGCRGQREKEKGGGHRARK